MTTDTVGGVWNYALELSRGLRHRGVETVLATMGPAPSEAQRAEARIAGVTLCESEFRLEWMDSPWRDVTRAGHWLLGLERQFEPDVIHVNGFVHGALPWSAPAIVVGHSCVQSWWRAVHGVAAPRRWNRYREAVRAGLRGAKRVIAPSRAMLQALEDDYGPLPAAAVIANGRDGAAFAPAAEKEPVVLSVGRLWDEAKNARALAAIAPRLAWPVRLAGSTAAPDRRVLALPNVEPLGQCSPATLAAQYARAAIYALPARYEPFGLSVLEAALSGCALVLGDIPSLREIWRDAALFVPPDDQDALHTAISELIADPMLRQWLAARARFRAANFTVEGMVDGYLAVYQEILAPTFVCPAASEALFA